MDLLAAGEERVGAEEHERSEAEPSCNAVVFGTHDDSALRPLVMRLVRLCVDSVFRSGDGAVLGDLHREGQAVLDDQDLDHAVPDTIELDEQVLHLTLERKVIDSGFAASAVVAAELDLADNPRRRIKHRLAIADTQILDPAEVDPLHHLDETTM
ncbi:MAG: hypothetical protein RLN60_01220 [Phycisphaerales bacterium]